ncbi:MAG TPA: hypothetical protein VL633_08880 [Bacteroidota bacterium]|jgi:hypothetical protein|nr:hypothetical protein [Bacteroidota bacterium]
MKPTARTRLALCLSAIVMMSGCGTSLTSLYPRLAPYKPSMASGALLADCVIVDDMMGDTNKVDLILNKSMGGMILTYFSDRMEGKGYHIDNDILTSVGLAMDRNQVYKVAQSIRSRELNQEDLPVALPPFYLNEIFNSDSAAGNLRETYDALVHTTSRSEGSASYVPSAASVGKQTGAETLLIILLGGFNVAPSEQLGDEITSDLGTIGKVAGQRVSQVTVAFYILDSRTGELLWADQRIAQGGTVYKEKILLLADKILDALP